MMQKPTPDAGRPGVSVIARASDSAGACQHLRLIAPFAWLERHEGWAPLHHALEAYQPGRASCFLLPWIDRLTRGYARCVTAFRQELLSVRVGLGLSFSPETEALLLFRNADPGFTDEAIRLARARRMSLVYDTDDLLLAVPDDSPVAADYAILHPLITRWIGRADHVTVSTPLLAAELSALNRSISVLPNALDVDLWGVSEIPRPNDGPITIGFWGSSTHLPDLRCLTPGLRHLKQRYGPRVRFHFLGCCDPELRSVEGVTVGEQVYSYADYAATTRHCRLDIAMAPLVGNLFNRCKSPIKFLEYGIRGACGLYADLEPYQGVVRPGENGLLLGPDPDDWISALTQLIEEPDRRYRMACQAQADVLAFHTIEHHAWRWREVYQSLIRETSPSTIQERMPCQIA